MKKKPLLAAAVAVLMGLVAWFAAQVPFFVFAEEGESAPSAMPFLLAVLLALACIIADVLLRKQAFRKEGKAQGRVQILHRSAVRPNPPPAFAVVRWSVMLLSFAALIWGGKLLNTSFSQLQLPVLACPFNQDQLTGASCFLFGHLDMLLEEGWRSALWFVGSFAASVLLFGRLLCGFVCPLGFLQDVAHELRQALHIEGVPLTEQLYAALRFVKWIMILPFLSLGLIGGSFCDICPAITVSPALAGFKTSVYFSGFMMVFVLVSGFFKRRCFCNICPMGYLLGLPHKVSLVKLKKNAIACTECGACYEACPMGIKSVFTVREGKDERCIDVTTTDCLLCGECVRRCPEDKALSLTFAGLPVYSASRERFMKEYAGAEE